LRRSDAQRPLAAGLLEQDQLNLLGNGNKLPVGALSNLEAPRSVSMKVVIVFVIAWCFLTIAVIVAASTRRFAAWDIYLLIAAVNQGNIPFVPPGCSHSRIRFEA